MNSTEELIARLTRRYSSITGMGREDLAQELRITALGSANVERALRNKCIDLARVNTRRAALAPMESLDPLLSKADSDGLLGPEYDGLAHAGWTPEEAIEHEAMDATLQRLAPDIDSARAAHRPLNTVRPGLAKSDWITRLIEKDPSFRHRLIEAGVSAMEGLPTHDPDAVRHARTAWRREAFRRSAGALGERTGVLARRPVNVEKVSGDATWPNYAGLNAPRCADWPKAISSITPRALSPRPMPSAPETPAERAEIDAYLKRVPRPIGGE